MRSAIVSENGRHHSINGRLFALGALCLFRRNCLAWLYVKTSRSFFCVRESVPPNRSYQPIWHFLPTRKLLFRARVGGRIIVPPDYRQRKSRIAGEQFFPVVCPTQSRFSLRRARNAIASSRILLKPFCHTAGRIRPGQAAVGGSTSRQSPCHYSSSQFDCHFQPLADHRFAATVFNRPADNAASRWRLSHRSPEPAPKFCGSSSAPAFSARFCLPRSAISKSATFPAQASGAVRMMHRLRFRM